MHWFFRRLLFVYRLFLSPFLGGRCRFYPSCSEYAKEALERHRWPKTFTLVLWRLLRCHPGSKGGVDFVP